MGIIMNRKRRHNNSSRPRASGDPVTPVSMVAADARQGLLDAPPSRGTTAEGGALYRLMAWLSPAFPVGAFSYSSGIEWAVEAGDITDADLGVYEARWYNPEKKEGRSYRFLIEPRQGQDTLFSKEFH